MVSLQYKKNPHKIFCAGSFYYQLSSLMSLILAFKPSTINWLWAWY